MAELKKPKPKKNPLVKALLENLEAKDETIEGLKKQLKEALSGKKEEEGEGSEEEEEEETETEHSTEYNL